MGTAQQKEQDNKIDEIVDQENQVTLGDEEEAEEEVVDPEAAQAAFLAGFTGDEEEADPNAGAAADADSAEAELAQQEQEQAAAAAAEPEPEPAPAAAADAGGAEDEDAMAQRLRKLEGKMGTVMRDLTNVIQGGTTAAPAADAPSQEQTQTIVERLRNGESFGEIKEEFPQWAAGLEALAEIVDASRGEASGANDTTDLVETITQQQTQIDYMRVEMSHKGWLNKIQSDPVKQWLVVQDPETQALYQSENPSDVIELLDRFEKFETDQAAQAAKDANSDTDTDLDQQQQQERLESAVPATTGTRTAPRKKVQTAEEAFREGFNS